MQQHCRAQARPLLVIRGGLLLGVLLVTMPSRVLACDLCLNFGCYDCAPSPDSAGGDAPTTFFGPTRPGWPQPGGQGSPVYLTYSYQNLHEGALLDPLGQPVPMKQIRVAIEEALTVWAAVAPLHFTEVEDDHLPYGGNTAGRQYGQIRFRHSYINGPDPLTGNPTTKAQAFFPGASPNSGDVEFDRGDPWRLIGTTREPDILGATIHELGHSLGLTHSTLPEANMYWIFRRHTGPGSGMLHADDIAAIHSIYGAGVGSVTPLSVASIPEPATGMIMLLTMFAVRRRGLLGCRVTYPFA
jgi:hypothetical protein